jgi:hypothetical protein
LLLPPAGRSKRPTARAVSSFDPNRTSGGLHGSAQAPDLRLALLGHFVLRFAADHQRHLEILSAFRSKLT